MISILTNILLSTATGGAIAYLLLRFVPTRLINHQFDRSLENYKFKINSQFDRISKVHEKEFQLLPDLWEKIYKTYGLISQIISPLKSYPDLNRYSELELIEFFEENDFKESTRIKISQSKDKYNEYINIDYWNKYNVMNRFFNDFNNQYFLNKIFLTGELDELIKKIRSSLIKCISIIGNSNHNDKIDYKFLHTADKSKEEIDIYLEELAALIKTRLLFEH